MKRFVQFQLIGGAGTTVAIDPQYVVQAQEFDSGRGGIGTTLKLVHGDTINVRGTLTEVLAQLNHDPKS
jgi:hypothetical protein